jgi:hypothetical protein
MKSKKGNIHPFTELHFISELPLHQSSELISCVAYPHPMVLTEVNPDTVKFDIQYENGTIEGTLQRWQGDETRINCAGAVHRVLENNNPDNLATNMVIVWLILSLALMFSQQFALGFAAMICLFVTATYLQNKDPEIIPIFRERDAIFQEIIDIFKANGEVGAL